MHAILGAGGVGGFVGAVLAAAGEKVLLLLRPESLAVHPGTLTLDSPFGHLVVPVVTATALTEELDILWVTTKATQLEAALGAVPAPSFARMVVPLLNGVDHVARLRSRFGAERVVPAAIAGELERTAAGQAGLAGAVEILTRFGCSCAFEAAAHEACVVATSLGANVDAEETVRTLRGFPGSLRSSMQKDVAAGRPPELDAIAGPILRGGAARGIPVPVTAQLVAMIDAAMAR
jgi:2-dehydropantoate 2-reductase